MFRSVNELKGYTIEATDGDIGEVVQFYLDDEKWTIRYLVADTGGWLMVRRVLISPASLGRVDWNSRRLHVKMTKGAGCGHPANPHSTAWRGVHRTPN
jgi:hypothetical protein